MTTLYGIKNCDTVKRARTALEDNKIPYQFHDFRVQGLDIPLAQVLLEALGADQLINRRGTTWRTLDDGDQALADGSGAANLLLRFPSLIKRPVIQHNKAWRVGFSRQDEAAILDWLGH
jgi:arsenate reductase